MTLQLANKNAIVAGASRGLGLHIAKALWEDGANLLLIARTEGSLSQLQTELKATARSGQFSYVLPCDLEKPESISTILGTAHELWDQAHILINNAAIQGPIGKS